MNLIVESPILYQFKSTYSYYHMKKFLHIYETKNTIEVCKDLDALLTFKDNDYI